MAASKEKNQYYRTRKEKNLTRENVIELLEKSGNFSISVDRLERIENDRIPASPSDVIALASVYNEPVLCNYYCAKECAIGADLNLALEIPELSNIVIETIASLNDIEPLTKDLIAISRDGKITDDEIPSFAKIMTVLNQASIAINSLDKWVEQEAAKNNINQELLEEELDRLRKH